MSFIQSSKVKKSKIIKNKKLKLQMRNLFFLEISQMFVHWRKRTNKLFWSFGKKINFVHESITNRKFVKLNYIFMIKAIILLTLLGVCLSWTLDNASNDPSDENFQLRRIYYSNDENACRGGDFYNHPTTVLYKFTFDDDRKPMEM